MRSLTVSCLVEDDRPKTRWYHGIPTEPSSSWTMIVAGESFAPVLGRRGLGGVGLVRKGGGHADRGEREGAGRYERQRCASVVEHCRLAFFTQKC